MAVRWFRIPYAHNALIRSLEGDGLELENLSITHAIRAMANFFAGFRPQHADLDELACEWGPSDDGWEFSIVRRMQRHGHPVNELRLVLGYTATANRVTNGSALVTGWPDARALEGYALTRGARPRYRLIEQRQLSSVPPAS